MKSPDGLDPKFLAANQGTASKAFNAVLVAIANANSTLPALLSLSTTAYPDGEIFGYFLPCRL